MDEMEDFHGFPPLSSENSEHRRDLLSDLISRLANLIEDSDASHAPGLLKVDNMDFNSESEIELSEDEGAEFLSADDETLASVESLIGSDEDEVVEQDDFTDDNMDDDESCLSYAGNNVIDFEEDSTCEATITEAETDAVIISVLNDILEEVVTTASFNKANLPPCKVEEGFAIQKDLISEHLVDSSFSNSSQLENSTVIGGRCLRARQASGASGEKSRSASIDSSGSREAPISRRSSRSRHSSGESCGSESSKKKKLRKGEESSNEEPFEGDRRQLRTRQKSNDAELEQPPESILPLPLVQQLELPRAELDNSSGGRSKSPSKASTTEESETPVESPVVVSVVQKKKLRNRERDSFGGKALEEAEILKRVAKLQSDGLWAGKKLAKKDVERQQGKIHWDFVLEEMTWLAGVVQQEIKTKKIMAKKCASMIQKHFKDKEMAAARAERNREVNLRKISSMMSREIKIFWGNVTKLFEYRLKIQLDVKRKEALDQHLNFIVDKTEKYSNMLAESLADNTGSGAPSRAESVVSEESPEADNDGEYTPDVESDDDEETIEKDEKEVDDKNQDNEIDMLENEAEVPIEDLLKKYYPDSFKDMEIKEKVKEDVNESTSEKGIGRSRRRAKPLNIEEIEAKIREEEQGKLAESSVKDGSNKEVDVNEVVEMPLGTKDTPLKEATEEALDGEDKLEEYASMAAKFQPTGNTLDTTTVKTKVPFLLKHTLREYQHIGLDWMVSLYERSLNGILADEMGLGKTIQTIAFMAHLATDQSNWGPHLIVVPTSVMLNWEMEIKKWCPAFKVLVYYGGQKERRLKRVGWTKQNAFHICITSYKLVIQDHSSFRRFKWQYLILDEAQHIKNFKSQRWQLLLNFTSLGRLLLTGTPLQNNLMELWSLMHFLMPHVFESHRDFKEWFSNPMSGMVEGNSEYNDSLIRRLHKVLRPFILRRLKKEVEKQMPSKYEHMVKCPLSKRQRFLYDDFMSRAKTKETISSGNLLSVINVLMQLRKCCNHPNLFEPRPTLSPLVIESAPLQLPSLASDLLAYHPLCQIDLGCTPLLFTPLETKVSAFASFRSAMLSCPSSTMLDPPFQASPSKCPREKLRLEVKSASPTLSSKHTDVGDSMSTICQLESSSGCLEPVLPLRHLSRPDGWLWQTGVKIKTPQGYYRPAKFLSEPILTERVDMNEDADNSPKNIEMSPVISEAVKRKAEDYGNVSMMSDPYQDEFRHAKGIFSSSLFLNEGLSSVPGSPTKQGPKRRKLEEKARDIELQMPKMTELKETQIADRRRFNLNLNNRKTGIEPMYGSDLVELLETMCLIPSTAVTSRLESLTCHPFNWSNKREISSSSSSHLRREEISCYSSSHMVPTLDNTVDRLSSVFTNFLMYVPATFVKNLCIDKQTRLSRENNRYPGDFLQSRFQVQTPDTRLIQYDCGKLQVLANLLRRLQAGAHRALIFTQMTKMLDVLEAFLNYHGYVYMRLDGSTKVETRQCLMERFNNDKKYFIFILSTRSGGVGINLTGADTVIFYDSDWNPTMDAQAQDRCHRIGQTRDVHIYRLVSERTVEENILKKANQKRLLGDIAIEGGNFTTAFFKKSTINDLFNDGSAADEDAGDAEEEDMQENVNKSVGVFENALATAEDDTDIQASKEAKAEENQDENDFKEEEDQFSAILNQLSSVEKYALRHMESCEADYAQGQLMAAEAEIEARKEEFDAEKLDELTQEIQGEMGETSDEEDDDNQGEQEEDSDADSDLDADDYTPENIESDDEDTIDKDEQEEKKDEFEINMLENEAEVPIEELLKMYYPDQLKKMQEEATDPDAGDEEKVRKTTRSRGTIDINLWNLENPEETFKTSGHLSSVNKH